jgi:hypothetical protein
MLGSMDCVSLPVDIIPPLQEIDNVKASPETMGSSVPASPPVGRRLPRSNWTQNLNVSPEPPSEYLGSPVA